MRDRSIVEVALRCALCVAVVATYALVRGAERPSIPASPPARPDATSADRRFRLVDARRTRRAPEDRCVACAGFGFPTELARPCDRCHGRGVERHDMTLVPLLDAPWNRTA